MLEGGKGQKHSHRRDGSWCLDPRLPWWKVQAAQSHGHGIRIALILRPL